VVGVGSGVAVGSGVGVGGMASAVWVMLTITVSATWVKIMFGSWVGSCGAASPQADKVKAITDRMAAQANLRVFWFIFGFSPYSGCSVIITDKF
jgi:hypothetical protein